jgi:hypothetical protein
LSKPVVAPYLAPSALGRRAVGRDSLAAPGGVKIGERHEREIGMTWCGHSWSAVARAGVLASVVGAACGGDGAGPALPACSPGAGFAVTLGVGQHAAVDPAGSAGCFAFGANAGPDSVEYLVVPLSGTGTAGITTSFRLAGAPASPLALHASLVADRPQGTPQRFHEFLRRAERERSWGAAPAEAPVLRGTFPPPVVGDRRVFSVCARPRARGSTR